MHNLGFKSTIIIVLAYLAFMVFAALAIVSAVPNRAHGADVPPFGIQEKELTVMSDAFSVERGYLVADRSEDDNLVILQYGRKNSESSVQVLQFCISKRTGLYFARAAHWFVKKGQRDTVQLEREAYEQLNVAKAKAIEIGYKHNKQPDSSDYMLTQGTSVIELAVRVEEDKSQFSIIVWDRKLKGE